MLPTPPAPVTLAHSALCRQRRRTRKRWQRVHSESAHREYSHLNNQVRRELRNARDSSFQNFMSSLTPHPNTNYSLWKATKKFRRAPIPPLPPLMAANRWVCDNDKKVELYADHLQKVFSPHDMPTLPIPDLEYLPSHPFSFSPRSVAYVLDRLNIKKAPGPDRITGRMLRELPRSGILWLTRIFNAMVRLGTFPEAWKSAKIIMLQKPGKKPTELTSYRLISLLSILSKVFEKLLHRKLLELLPPQHYQTTNLDSVLATQQRTNYNESPPLFSPA